jgi:hypothetical protein
MPVMSTALTEFSDQGNSRVYALSGHNALRPKLVLQKRKSPVGNAVIAEDTITVLHATVDSDGNVLAPRVSATITIRRPLNGASADIDAVVAVLRDIVASDNLTTVVASQNWLTAHVGA